MTTSQRATLTIAIAPAHQTALSLALSSWHDLVIEQPITLVTDQPESSPLPVKTRATIESMARDEIRVVQRPTGLSRLSGLLKSPSEWVEIDRTGRGGLFGRVRVPSALQRPASLVALTSVPTPERRARPPLMAFWAGMAHPRQASVALMAGPMSGLVAELAFAFDPCLNVLVGSLGADAFAIVSDDILAADLGWLALAPTSPDEEVLGPWQHPVIQHAADMGFGVPGPEQLDLQFLARPDQQERRQRLDSEIRIALGVPIA